MAILEKITNHKFHKIRNLGYFLGSFDPLHEGHVAVVNKVLKKRLCDHVLIYCVRGAGSYKERSDFFSRTKVCEEHFAKNNRVLVSYLSPIQLQKKITVEKDGMAIPAHRNLKISGIIGSDVALQLETPNQDAMLEKIRMKRQADFMRGLLIDDDSDSVSCCVIIPVTQFFVALRNRDEESDIAKSICGRKVSGIIDTGEHRFMSSSETKSSKNEIAA